MEALVALVLAITQVGKSWIKSWFKIPDEQWQPWMSVILSFVASIGVVAYTEMKAGTGIDLNDLWTVLGAFALANGAKKIITTLKK